MSQESCGTELGDAGQESTETSGHCTRMVGWISTSRMNRRPRGRGTSTTGLEEKIKCFVAVKILGCSGGRSVYIISNEEKKNYKKTTWGR